MFQKTINPGNNKSWEKKIKFFPPNIDKKQKCFLSIKSSYIRVISEGFIVCDWSNDAEN